jgi:two-component system response regulator MprA
MPMAWVLVADDDRAIRETIELVLVDAGYKVVLAPDGAEALAELRGATRRYVVLLDHRMPKLDGFAVLRAVASDARLRERHAYMLVSAIPRLLTNEEVALLSSLAAGVLPKPFDISDLLDAVERAAQRISGP